MPFELRNLGSTHVKLAAPKEQQLPPNLCDEPPCISGWADGTPLELVARGVRCLALKLTLAAFTFATSDVRAALHETETNFQPPLLGPTLAPSANSAGGVGGSAATSPIAADRLVLVSQDAEEVTQEVLVVFLAIGRDAEANDLEQTPTRELSNHDRDLEGLSRSR